MSALLGSTAGTVAVYAGFVVFVLVVLGLDLGLLHRHARIIGACRALFFTAGTVVMALAFAVGVYFAYEENWLGIAGRRHGEGGEAAIQFVTGWLIEYSLSLDNILVMAIIFQHFRVPREHQHRVLFWGVLGALVFRGLLIAGGALLVQSFHWILYVFGAVLLVTAARLLYEGGTPPDPGATFAARLARRIFPFSPDYDGERFFTRAGPSLPGRFAMTPLFLVLCVIETTDIVFAVDSIPAVFAVTSDPFLVFTSNVFAILGLRSLYFALEAVIDRFRYLKVSLVIVLGFIGLKMLASRIIDVPPLYSLLFVALTLSVGLIASLVKNRLQRLEATYSAPALASAAETALRHAKRVFIFLIGFTVIAFGLIAGLAPGIPGIPIMLVGLAILATEFIWARLLLKRMKAKAEEFAQRARQFLTTGAPPPPPPPRPPPDTPAP